MRRAVFSRRARAARIPSRVERSYRPLIVGDSLARILRLHNESWNRALRAPARRGVVTEELTRGTSRGYVKVMMRSVTRRSRRDPRECETQSLFWQLNRRLMLAC
jgi:hypothetical protein